jgi:alanine racemase
VHLKVDTGMARLGCKPSSALELAQLIHGCDHLRFDGICTHFSSVGAADEGFTDRQIRTFNRVVGDIERAGIPVPQRHAAASAAILSGIATHLDMVRPGLALYGIGPTAELQAGLTPALSLKTQVIFLKDCPAKTPVGYNRTHVTPQRTRVATLPVGYNDGYPFRLGGRGQVIVRGRKCSVIGRVSMDYLTIDVGHVPGVSVGDEVVLIGASGRESITATDLAEQCGTIPYEILTRIGRRVTRVFAGGRPAREVAPDGESRGFGILRRPGLPLPASEIEPGRR